MPIVVNYNPNGALTGAAALLAGNGMYRRVQQQMAQQQQQAQLERDSQLQRTQMQIDAQQQAQKSTQEFQRSQNDVNHGYDMEKQNSSQDFDWDKMNAGFDNQSDLQDQQFEHKKQMEDSELQHALDLNKGKLSQGQEAMANKYQNDLLAIEKAHADGHVDDSERDILRRQALDAMLKIKGTPMGATGDIQDSIDKNSTTDAKGNTWIRDPKTGALKMTAAPKPEKAPKTLDPLDHAKKVEQVRAQWIKNNTTEILDNEGEVIGHKRPSKAEADAYMSTVDIQGSPAAAASRDVPGAPAPAAPSKPAFDPSKPLSQQPWLKPAIPQPNGPSFQGDPGPAGVTPPGQAPAAAPAPLPAPTAAGPRPGSYPSTWTPSMAQAAWNAMQSAKLQGVTDPVKLKEIATNAVTEFNNF